MTGRRPAGAGGRRGQGVRFLATLPSTPRRQALSLVGELGLDRLPDAKGKVQLLISAEDAQRLVDKGIAVQLLSALPVAPLDQSRIRSDEQARGWLEQRLKGVVRKGGG